MSAIYAMAQCHIRVGSTQLVLWEQQDCHKRFLLFPLKEINDNDLFEHFEYSNFPYWHIKEMSESDAQTRALPSELWVCSAAQPEEKELNHLSWH